MDLQGQSLRPGEESGPKETRLVYWYTIPPELRGESRGVVKVGLVALTPNEEMMAAARCGSNPIRLAWEQALEALKGVAMLGPTDGQGNPTYVKSAVTTADGTADRVWNQFGPKVRSLCLTAFGDINNPKTESVSSFLESREAVAG